METLMKKNLCYLLDHTPLADLYEMEKIIGQTIAKKEQGMESMDKASLKHKVITANN